MSFSFKSFFFSVAVLGWNGVFKVDSSCCVIFCVYVILLLYYIFFR